MYEIIIDTIVLDYLTRNQKAISPTALKHIKQADIVYVSITSIWELANHVRSELIPLNADFDTFYQDVLHKLGLTLLDTQWKALKYFSSFDYLTINKPFTKSTNGVITQEIKNELHKDS